MSRSYTATEKAEAVGLALAIGDKAAAARLGIPRRTLSRWRADLPADATIRADTRAQVAAKLWEAVTIGVSEVIAGLRDPSARLSDKARALEVVAQQHALMTGGPTARTETVASGPPLTADEEAGLRGFLDMLERASDDELRAWLADGGLGELVEAHRQLPLLGAGGVE